jgi:uncharacterized protein (TIGR02594 family)
MVQLHAFRRLLRVVSLCLVTLASVSTAMVASSTSASARTHHRTIRHFHAHYVHAYYVHAHHAHARYARTHHARAHYVHRHFAGRYLAYRHYRHVARLSRWDAGVAQMRAGGFANSNASIAPYSSGGMASSYGATASQRSFTPQSSFSSHASFGSSDVVTTARRYIGGNPTGRGSLWCARFMNMVLQQTGHHGTGSDLASSFAHYGQRVSGPQIGAIAVMARRGGGHVGVVSGIDAAGDPILVSGNNGNRVREAPIARGRIYAYVLPNG